MPGNGRPTPGLKHAVAAGPTGGVTHVQPCVLELLPRQALRVGVRHGRAGEQDGGDEGQQRSLRRPACLREHLVSFCRGMTSHEGYG